MWHSDGIEFRKRPSASFRWNLHYGVWKQTGSRSVKLHHIGIIWGSDSKIAATFTVDEENTVSEDGKSYSGTFEFNQFDPSGNPAGSFKEQQLRQSESLSKPRVLKSIELYQSPPRQREGRVGMKHSSFATVPCSFISNQCQASRLTPDKSDYRTGGVLGYAALVRLRRLSRNYEPLTRQHPRAMLRRLLAKTRGQPC